MGFRHQIHQSIPCYLNVLSSTIDVSYRIRTTIKQMKAGNLSLEALACVSWLVAYAGGSSFCSVVHDSSCQLLFFTQIISSISHDAFFSCSALLDLRSSFQCGFSVAFCQSYLPDSCWLFSNCHWRLREG